MVHLIGTSHPQISQIFSDYYRARAILARAHIITPCAEHDHEHKSFPGEICNNVTTDTWQDVAAARRRLPKCFQPFTFPHGRSPHYKIVYTFTRRVLCQILRATKLTPTPYQFGSQLLLKSICVLHRNAVRTETK